MSGAARAKQRNTEQRDSLAGTQPRDPATVSDDPATVSDDSAAAADDPIVEALRSYDPIVEALRSYKYVSPELSYLERRALDDLWRGVVERCFPLWLAPNIVTLCGGACIASAVLLTLTHSPLLEGAAPSWVYVVNALLIFLYQTFDGSDGKQARRTASGSPLGELMDHGVDAVVVGGIVALTTDAFGLGLASPWAWIKLVGAQASFHASNLTLVLGGRMIVHASDATELQWAIIGVHIVSATFGPCATPPPLSFWGSEPPQLDAQQTLHAAAPRLRKLTPVCSSLRTPCKAGRRGRRPSRPVSRCTSRRGRWTGRAACRCASWSC